MNIIYMFSTSENRALIYISKKIIFHSTPPFLEKIFHPHPYCQIRGCQSPLYKGGEFELCNQFSSSSLDFWTFMVDFVKRLCNANMHLSHLVYQFHWTKTQKHSNCFWWSPAQNCRKSNHVHSKKDLQDAAGSFQVWAGQEAG